MNGKKTNLRTDTEAVSGVIGAVLLMAIAVTMLTLFQASVVPYWNKQVEAEEMRVTYDDMMFLPSDIEDVAIHETPKTFTVQLGAHYPDRMIFRNPGPGAFGTLAVKEASVPIIVNYDNGTNPTESFTFNSKRITYEMSGTINSPKLVYEHGVIITDWKWENVNLTTDEQKLIANDNIYIPILNGSSISKSAIGVESLAIKPYEYLDTLGDIVNVTVTLDTEYPKVWWGLLEEYIDQGMVSISNQSKKINITTDVPYLKLPNQTASGPLHAGMISCTLEDPDGGGGGGNGGGGVGDANGTGDGIMSSGTLWCNIPGSLDMTKMDITRIVYDVTGDLSGNILKIVVTDNDGDWWRILITFDKNPDEITSITARSGTTTKTSSMPEGRFPITLPLTNPIDLLGLPPNYDIRDACYQDAAINQSNTSCLVTYLDTTTASKHTDLIWYLLEIK